MAKKSGRRPLKLLSNCKSSLKYGDKGDISPGLRHRNERNPSTITNLLNLLKIAK